MYKLNRKGVTLIELLAIIILLGIITLVTVPSVLSSIDKVEKETSEENVKRYAKVLEEKRLEQEYIDGDNKDDDLNELGVVYTGGIKCRVAKYDEVTGIELNNCMVETDFDNRYCYINGEVLKNDDCGPLMLLSTAIKEDNVISSPLNIDYSKTSRYGTNYTETVEDVTTYTFDSNRYYWFTNSYTFDAVNGKYIVGDDAKETSYSNGKEYKYVCGNTNTSKKCVVLYELVKSEGSSNKYNEATVIPHTSYTDNYNDNGVGLFKESVNGSDTYFFRGNVNNNVKFAGYEWKIIRINEDGSIRLILSDSIGRSTYNDGSTDNVYIGYMYGTKGSSTYSATHSNTNSSTIKTFLEDWYSENLLSYAQYIADSGFCNDRSLYTQNGYAPLATTNFSDGSRVDITDTGLGYSKNATFYGAAYRLKYNSPRFDCINSNDLFTVSTGNGNGKLTYPIGLITADEVIYAGGVFDELNRDYYLFLDEQPWWTMSPMWFLLYTEGDGSQYRSSIIAGVDGIYHHNASDSEGLYVRPVINLNADIGVYTGDGSSKAPYVLVN